jgi:hypothetical protein
VVISWELPSGRLRDYLHIFKNLLFQKKHFLLKEGSLQLKDKWLNYLAEAIKKLQSS